MLRSRTFFNALRRNNRVAMAEIKSSFGGSQKSPASTAPPTATSSKPPMSGINSDVPGLSNRCVKPVSGPVGRPGASATAEYKVPEYFCYSKTSYAEAEIEMAKYRCPQPSNQEKK